MVSLRGVEPPTKGLGSLRRNTDINSKLVKTIKTIKNQYIF